MAAASSASVASNDAENRIVGMMVGSAVADAVGIYTNGLAKEKINQAYGRRRRIIASYKANELTHHFPDKHRAQYEVSGSQPTMADSERKNACPRDSSTPIAGVAS